MIFSHWSSRLQVLWFQLFRKYCKKSLWYYFPPFNRLSVWKSRGFSLLGFSPTTAEKKRKKTTQNLSPAIIVVCANVESRFIILFHFFFTFLLYSWCCSRWDETLLGCVRCWELFRLTTYCCVSSLSHQYAGVGWSSAHVSFSPFVCGAFTFFPFIFSLFTCIHMYVESILIRKVFVSPRCVSLRVCRCACEFVGKAFVGCGKCCKC